MVTQEEVNEIVSQVMQLHREVHPYTIEINPEWASILSPDRVNVIMEVVYNGVKNQLRNSRIVEMTGAMRWGPSFHQEVLINMCGELV